MEGWLRRMGAPDEVLRWARGRDGLPSLDDCPRIEWALPIAALSGIEPLVLLGAASGCVRAAVEALPLRRDELTTIAALASQVPPPSACARLARRADALVTPAGPYRDAAPPELVAASRAARSLCAAAAVLAESEQRARETPWTRLFMVTPTLEETFAVGRAAAAAVGAARGALAAVGGRSRSEGLLRAAVARRLSTPPPLLAEGDEPRVFQALSPELHRSLGALGRLGVPACMTVEHLLLALVSDAGVEALVTRSGGDPGRLAGSLRARLADPFASLLAELPDDELHATLAARSVLAAAGGRAARGPQQQAGPCAVLAELFAWEDASAVELLAGEGVTVLGARLAAAHGEPPDSEELRADRCRIVVHNDDYTTFDFVIGTLRAVFGFSASLARALAMQTHEEGTAVLGVYALPMARALAARVRALAGEQDFPLLVTLEALEAPT